MLPCCLTTVWRLLMFIYESCLGKDLSSLAGSPRVYVDSSSSLGLIRSGQSIVTLQKGFTAGRVMDNQAECSLHLLEPVVVVGIRTRGSFQFVESTGQLDNDLLSKSWGVQPSQSRRDCQVEKQHFRSPDERAVAPGSAGILSDATAHVSRALLS